MTERKFATVINCMDGRVQEPVIAYLKQRLGVAYVDSITLAGPIKTLAERTRLTIIDSVKRRVETGAQMCWNVGPVRLPGVG